MSTVLIAPQTDRLAEQHPGHCQAAVSEIFHHTKGGFPLTATAYRLDGEVVHVEVDVGGALHSYSLEGVDVQRFARAIADSQQHYHWPGRALPRHGTLYEIEVDQEGRPRRVSWWWASQDGLIAGTDALAFLRSAGVLQRCSACGEERLIAPEFSICGRCGYLAADSWERTSALMEGHTD